MGMSRLTPRLAFQALTEFLQCRLVLRNLAYNEHLVLFVVHGVFKEVSAVNVRSLDLSCVGMVCLLSSLQLTLRPFRRSMTCPRQPFSL